MSLISALNLSYQAGTKSLFSDLNCHINVGDRIGLVGNNGCGKSTLLKLLAGQSTLDDGRLQVQRGLKIGLVEQFLPKALTNTRVFDSVLQCLSPDEQLTDGYRVEFLLDQLGFRATQFQRPLQQLSGGQKNLVLFARAIIQSPQLLLLDEPGNHMDSSALFYLKRYLSQRDVPAFVMIAHDRDLLDSVTDRTLWLRDERIYSFNAPYSQAKAELQMQDEAAARARAAEEREIQQLRASATRLATWGKVYDNEGLARKAKSMEKRIDKLEADVTFVTQGSGLALQVDSEQLKAKQLFIFEDTQIRNPVGQPLFHVEELNCRPGDRIALLGVNGAGKSSAVEHLMAAYRQPLGEQTRTRFNPNVRIGYIDQELRQFEQATGIADWLHQHCRANSEDIRQALIQWGFPYADHGRRVNVLSGGERARLKLLTFQLDQPNLLIMDEPTNHLDLQGKESLEQDLCQPGLSLLFTSHDRRFIETVATRFWWIDRGQLVEISDPAVYFESLEGRDRQPADSGASGRTSTVSVDAAATDEEVLLERIVELERLLDEDRARKPKFQKPARQRRWQSELDELMARLEN